MRHFSVPNVAIGAVLLLNAVACGSTATGPGIGLITARARWAQQAPAAYSMTMSRSCECLPEMSGPVVVLVRNGVVESRRYVASGAEVSAAYAALFPTVDELFATIDAAVRSGVRPLAVQYDATLGYPTRVAIGDPAVDAPVTVISSLEAR